MHDIRRPCRLRDRNFDEEAGGSGSDAETAEPGASGAGDGAVEVIQGGRSSLATIGAVGLEVGPKRAKLSRFVAATPSAAAPLVRRQRAAFRCALAMCVADAQAAFLRSCGKEGSPEAAGGASAFAVVLDGGGWHPKFQLESVTLEVRNSHRLGACGRRAAARRPRGALSPPSSQDALARARTAAAAPLPTIGEAQHESRPGSQSPDPRSEEEDGAGPVGVCAGSCGAACAHSAAAAGGPFALPPGRVPTGGAAPRPRRSASSAAGTAGRRRKGGDGGPAAGGAAGGAALGSGRCRSVEPLAVDAFLEHLQAEDGIGSQGQASRAPLRMGALPGAAVVGQQVTEAASRARRR